MDGHLLEICLNGLGGREVVTGTGDRTKRKGRGEPGAIGEIQALYAACKKPGYHRVACPYSTFHQYGRWKRHQRGCRVDKQRAALAHGNDYQLYAIIQELASGLVKPDFTGC